MRKTFYCIFTVIAAVALAFGGFQSIALSQNMAAINVNKNQTTVAALAPSATPKKFINPTTIFSGVKYGFSQAIATGGRKTIYLSGQVAWDTHQRTIGVGDLAVQTKKALENLGLVLEASEAARDDVVQIEVFVVDYKPEDVDIIAEAVSTFFSRDTPPTSTLIGVQSLAYPDLLVEIKATAVLD